MRSHKDVIREAKQLRTTEGGFALCWVSNEISSHARALLTHVKRIYANGCVFVSARRPTVQVERASVIDARTEMWRQQQQRNNTNASIWQKVAFFENCQQDDATTSTAITIGV